MTAIKLERRNQSGAYVKLTDEVSLSSPHNKMVLRKQELADLLGISLSTIDNRLNQEHPSFCPDFPKPRYMGPANARGSIVFWVGEDVIRYIVTRPEGSSRAEDSVSSNLS
jgi:predicted DNA-binding transcriptional regulator AlpA